MLGYLHSCLQAMIVRYNGVETYKQVLKSAGYEMDVEWDARAVYPDTDTYRLFRAVAAVLGQTSEEVWENYGVWMCIYAVDNGWDKFLNCIANDLHEFLDNLSSMHFFIDQIAFQAEMRGPSFKCEAKTDGSLRLHYYSVRKGLFPLAKGMVRQAAKSLFGVDITMVVTERSQERRNDVLTEHVIFTVEAVDEHVQLARSIRPLLNKEAAIPKPLSMSVQCFCSVFPTHVCFNKSLVIEHCGDFLQREFSLTKRRMTKLTDIFTLVQPDDISLTFKGIQTYLNSLFIFQFKENMMRNEQTKGGKKNPFSLKGQMVLVNGGNCLLYINSPHITNPKMLLDANLYLNDMQRHDATRDLIMLNQTRISQQELNKKLEDTVRRMKKLSDELETKKNQADHLMFESIPPVVAESIRRNEKAVAQEYKEVTCLCYDMPFFSAMQSHCAPSEVVDVMSEVFKRCDRLVELLSCFKVYSLMDSYMAVCGAPEQNTEHVDQILNLALGMIVEAKQVIIPQLELPVILRIAVHSGPVVGGVMGNVKMRYCVFSETVNVCKRLTQHVEPGKILVTNATKLLASKSTRNNFSFTTRGYLSIGNNQATCTFFLDRNLKRSVWDITQRTRGENASVDGSKELLTAEDVAAWSVYDSGPKISNLTFVQSKPNVGAELFQKWKDWKNGGDQSLDSGHGFIHNCLEAMVIRRESLDAYRNMLRKAGVGDHIQWSPHEAYADELTFRLFHALGAITQQTLESTLEQFGEWMFSYAMESKFRPLLRSQSTSLQGFLDNLSSMHYFLDSVSFGGKSLGPTFRCEANHDGSLTLHYFSNRKGLYPMVKGLIRQAADELFHQDIYVVVRERSQEKRKNILTEHVLFVISSPDGRDSLLRPIRAPAPLMLGRRKNPINPITLHSFCLSHPTHVCFNKQMIVEHCGIFLQEEFDMIGKRVVKLADILTIVQPEEVPMSFRSFQMYLNSPFVFHAKYPLHRNSLRVCKTFALKGQIQLVGGGEYMLFMGSPYFTNVNELLESNIFIADMQRHDATRDLILLNQSLNTQQDLNRRLEESVDNMRRMATELGEKRRYTEELLCSRLPPVIAEKWKRNVDSVKPEMFPEASCLLLDVPHFQFISTKLLPRELFDLLERLFRLIDGLIERHNCVKVVSVFESYFIVAGAPAYQPDHAERILNLSLAITEAAQTIIVPKVELPVLVRVAVNSGSLIGGIVGSNRSRYCIISETVNSTKRLLHHSQAGRILVTNSAKTYAMRSKTDTFTFLTHNYFKLGANAHQATCTFFLEKNSAKTSEQLTGILKDKSREVDPTMEFTVERAQTLWLRFERQQLGLRDLHNRSGSGPLIMRKLRETWKLSMSERSVDSGISHGSLSSTACNIQ